MPAITSTNVATSLPNVPSTRTQAVADACNNAAIGQTWAGSDVLATLAQFGWWYPLTEPTAAFSDAAATTACTNGSTIQVQKSWITQNNLVQATAGSRPTFNTATGASFVRASSQSLEISNSLITGTTFCLFILGKPSPSASGLFAKIGNASTGFGLGVGGANGDAVGTNFLGLREGLAWVGTGATLSLSPATLAYSQAGTNGSYYKDSSNVSNPTGQTITTPTGTFGIGGHNGIHYLDSSVYSVLVGAFNPTGTQVIQVNTFLRSFHGFNILSYDAGTDTVTLGGTESTPDTLDAIVAVVGNTAKAVKIGAYTYNFSFAALNGANGFLQFNQDTVTILNNVRWDRNGSTGGAIFRERSVVRHEGSGQSSPSCAANAGYKFIAYRDIEGVNPRYILASSSRYDYFTANDAPVNTPTYAITGLDLETIGSNSGLYVSASLKIFVSGISSISNLRVFSRDSLGCEFQAQSGVFSFLGLEGAGIATSATAGQILTLAQPTVNFKGTSSPLSFNFNNTATVNIQDPLFPNGNWNGSYLGFVSGFRSDSSCLVNVSYTSKLAFLNNSAPKQLKARHTRNDGVNIDLTANASGAISQLLLTSTRNGTGFALGTIAANATYTWSITARKYDYVVAADSDALYVAQSFSSASSLSVQVSLVPFLSLSESAAAALTGISLVASGATSGTAALSTALTSVQVWQYYRQFIATFANFGSTDKWNYDGTILDFDVWNVTLTAALTGRIKSAGTITLGVGGSVTSAIATATTIVIVQPGNVDLRGWTFAVGATINVSSTTAIVTVNDATGITVGTGVTLQTPQATIRFHGMPVVSNTILFVQDLTTNAIIYPTIASGEAIVTVNAARNYKIRADAPGYLASPFVTISGASVDFQFGLTDYRALYLSGVNRSSQITFDPITYLITISDLTPALSFADVFVTIEDYLATPQGLNYTAHPYPVVLPDRNILQFPYDTTTNAINPARIKPAVGNLTDPALLFETYLERAADPSYGLFDFSTSNGRIIRIRSVVAIAQVASATIAPSQQQIRDALTIPASSTVAAGSIDSKLALIPTTDASIPIAAIKVQTDKFVFTTAGRVDATAIGVPTNPLITTDSRLSNLDAAVSSRASQAALNAIPINPLLTTDTRLSNLDALVSSRASQTALNAIPTNPLVTTDSRLSNLDALVSSRASQITLNAIPTNPVLISDSRLSNLDDLVSSRATQASINALPTLTAIEGSIVLFKSSNYTAPDNAGIGSLNSKLTSARANGFDSLSNLDALITSRATPDQVWAVSYLSLTQVGTIGRMLYWIGKMFGATSTPVTASNTARTTGDGTINQTITTNPDGSKTMSGNP